MKILLTGAYKYTEGQLSRLKALGADYTPSMYEVEVGELRGY